MLADFDGMVENCRDHAQRRRGRVALAALPSLAAGWLPDVFAEYRARHPGIELALLDQLSEQCLSLVRSGQVDFALVSFEVICASMPSYSRLLIELSASNIARSLRASNSTVLFFTSRATTGP